MIDILKAYDVQLTFEYWAWMFNANDPFLDTQNMLKIV